MRCLVIDFSVYKREPALSSMIKQCILEVNVSHVFDIDDKSLIYDPGSSDTKY